MIRPSSPASSSPRSSSLNDVGPDVSALGSTQGGPVLPPEDLPGLREKYGAEAVTKAQALLRGFLDKQDIALPGRRQPSTQAQVKMALEDVAVSSGATGAAVDTLPWTLFDGQDPELSEADLIRATQAVAVLFESSLPTSVKKSLAAVLKAVSATRVGHALWTSAQSHGAMDAGSALSLAKAGDKAENLNALFSLVRMPAEDLEPLHGPVLELIREALHSLKKDWRETAFALAERMPLTESERRDIANISSSLMVLDSEDETKASEAVLDPVRIAKLLASSNPTAEDVQRFFKRAFGSSTQEQHLDALTVVGAFNVAEDVKRGILDYAIQQFPPSVGSLAASLPSYGLSPEAQKAYLQRALSFVKTPAEVYKAAGFDVENDAAVAPNAAFAAAGLMDGLANSRLEPATVSAVFEALASHDVAEVKAKVAYGCGGLLAEGNPLAARAAEVIKADLNSGDADLCLAATWGLLRAPAGQAKETLLVEAMKHADGRARESAIFAYLGDSNDEQALSLLQSMANDPSLRRAVPQALVLRPVASANTEALIRPLIATGDAELLVCVAQQLGRLSLSASVQREFIQALGTHASADVRTAVAAVGAQSAPQSLREKWLQDELKVATAAFTAEVDRKPDNLRALTDAFLTRVYKEGDEAAWFAGGDAVARGAYPLNEKLALVRQWADFKTPEAASAIYILIARSPKDEGIALAAETREVYQKQQQDPTVVHDHALPAHFSAARISDADAARINALEGVAVSAPSPADGAANDKTAPVDESNAQLMSALTEVLAQAQSPEKLRRKLRETLAALPPEQTGSLLEAVFAHEAQTLPPLDVLERLMLEDRKARFSPANAIMVEDVPLRLNEEPDKREMLVPKLVPLKDVGPTKENRRAVAEGWRLNKPVWLKGPPGSGKTAIIREVCARTKTPFRRFNLNPYTDVSELLGKWIPDKKDPTRGKFAPGPILEAAIRGECLLLDEANLAPGEVMIALNGLLDDRGNIQVMGFNDDKPFKPHRNFRIFCATNGDSEVGRKRYDEAVLDRWTIVPVDGLSEADVRQIVTEKYGDKIPSAPLTHLVSFHQQMADAAEEAQIQGDAGTVYFSLRNIERVCTRFLQYRQMGPDGRPNADLDEAIMRREAEEIYVGGFLQAEDKALGNNLLDAAFSVGNDAATATVQFKENPELPGTFLLEETPEGFKLGDVVWPKLNNGGDLVPQFKSPFVFTARTAKVAYRTMKALMNGEHPLLVGDRGCGKTMLLQYLAALAGQGYFEDVFHSETDPSTVIGQYQGDNQWHDGKLVSAIRQDGFYLADEPNVPRGPVTERFNPILDGEGRLYITENDGEFLDLPSHFRFTAAINPASYRNRTKFSGAFINRCTVIGAPPLNQAEELKIILGIIGQNQKIEAEDGTKFARPVPKEWTDAMVDLVDWVNKETAEERLNAEELEAKTYGMRTLKAYLEYVADFSQREGWQQAFINGAKFCLKLTDPNDRKAVMAKAKELAG